MLLRSATLLGHIFILLLITPGFNQWVEFTDETSTRLVLETVPDNDGEEKDVGLGDFNNDGWPDVVVVRKEPFSNPGAKADLLLMNVEGQLLDMTGTYAAEFISNPSDARDVLVLDLDDDGWEDIVIANTFEQQPFYYANLGEDGNGQWLGFEHQSSSRFPEIGINPLQFCAIWAGDLTGNGAPDIFFSNYDPSGLALDVLFINDGNGVFTDQSTQRLGELRKSAFGTSCEISDIDNDGDLDIIKSSTLFDVPPWNDLGIFTLYNNGIGLFSNWQQIPSTDPYMFTIGDLNNDGFQDVYVIDDQQDYINIAMTLQPDTNVTYQTIILSQSPRTTGFGGNVKMADIDNDGDLDVGVADVDVDIQPCESSGLRKFTLLRNEDVHSGNLVDPYGTEYNGWNESTFDFTFIDINQDGWLDIFCARCTEYAIFMQAVDQVLISPPELNFGEVLIGETVTDSVFLINTTADTFTVQNITINDSVYALSGQTLAILPGETGVIGVSFQPDSAGTYPALMEIFSDTAGAPLFSVPVAGTGSTPAMIVLSADSLTAVVPQGDTAYVDLIIQNTGSQPLDFQIAIAPPNFWISLDPVSGSVSADSQLTVTAMLGRDVIPAGVYETDITLTSNDLLDPEIIIPARLRVDKVVAVDDEGDSFIPEEFLLEQNYPNPFNPTTHIGFRISDFGLVRIHVYDIRGMLVKTVIDREMAPGRYTASWDGRNNAGSAVASGLYVYRMTAGSFTQTRKMMLLK